MKPETSVFTVRLPAPLQAELDELAEDMDRSRSWLVAQALEEYVRVQRWHMEQIRLAVKEADAGDFASDAQMEAVWNKYKTPKP